MFFKIGQGTVTPPLPKEFQASQLLHSDISMKAAIAPRSAASLKLKEQVLPNSWMFSVFCSMSFHTYAVMGVNTAFIQATLVSTARVYTVLPAKIEAKMNMVKGNFKFEFLPVQGIDKIVSAKYVIYFVM